MPMTTNSNSISQYLKCLIYPRMSRHYNKPEQSEGSRIKKIKNQKLKKKSWKAKGSSGYCCYSIDVHQNTCNCIYFFKTTPASSFYFPCLTYFGKKWKFSLKIRKSQTLTPLGHRKTPSKLDNIFHFSSPTQRTIFLHFDSKKLIFLYTEPLYRIENNFSVTLENDGM